MAKKRRGGPEINSSSMADIAFLLLIFFLVTTTIANDRGLSIMLPPPPEQLEQMDIKIPEKNLFKIQVNSFDKVLVEGEPMEDFSKLRPMIKEFILNFGAPDADYVQVYNAMPASLKGLSKRDPRSSDHPKVAIVTYKTDRGTSYKTYIELLDEIQGAYY
ncbi:MAG TPA: biopolymer transporter ExbD, partial [Cyclobacteriaceae bacterium]|nr:biopolymer transporter ExbD [Cyclobacteriaceae bacterium]